MKSTYWVETEKYTVKFSFVCANPYDLIELRTMHQSMSMLLSDKHRFSFSHTILIRHLILIESKCIFRQRSSDIYRSTINRIFFKNLLLLFSVVPSKRTYTKKSGVVTNSIDKRYNPTNQEDQDSSSSSDDLKTMTEVCYIQKLPFHREISSDR